MTAEDIAENPQGERAENVPTTEKGTKERTKAQRSFGGLTPKEAGQRSAQRRREREMTQATEAAEQSSGKVVLVRSPVVVGDIIAKLEGAAKRGDVQAARELREWMRQYPAEDETDMSALDRRTRQQVIAKVLADIIEEEGAAPSGPLSE